MGEFPMKLLEKLKRTPGGMSEVSPGEILKRTPGGIYKGTPGIFSKITSEGFFD